MSWNKTRYYLATHGGVIVACPMSQVMTVDELPRSCTMTPPVIPLDTNSYIDRAVREMAEDTPQKP